MITLKDLFELTIPYKELGDNSEYFYMSNHQTPSGRRLYKTCSIRPKEKLNLPKDINIILSKYAASNGTHIGFVLIDTRDTDDIEYNKYLLFENDLNSDLSNDSIKKILDFLIESKELVEADKLPKLIEAAVEVDKLSKLIEADPRSNINYKQLIIYGPAGVGKTYGIRNIAIGLKIYEYNFEKQTVHTVFHPEYSYYDFFGKVMPIKDKNSQISYDFLPGPFAQALSKAYKNITNQPINPEKVVLVVDELNRGNAASIFGGLFNLLDRNNIGISEYPLNIYGMEAMWLKEQIGDLSTLEKYSKKTNFEMYDEENKSLKIFIPDNLSIICTMNTSDQTIFSLDKAFQRRFNKNFITAQESIGSYSKEYENNEIKIKDYDFITWKDFLSKLNKFIVDNAEVEDVDNATIGAYFVKPKDGYILTEDIKYTIMYYLWYDLFSGYRRETLKEKLAGEIQKVKTFEEFVDKYKEFIKKIYPQAFENIPV
ncbi:AAA family ATPase [Aliarcobacter cryaerophilus]|uniref:AAA family ATPase n=1 Tax=Aliarcobacter cryaerophilus TaxID=28198 RepID=UPI0021B342B7|nr:AAA family ATPase [Aliarcobacter cryaerophilus]MCT7464579.1 AAA family ATPase [Aliarcobacter cryaerophilus]